MLVHDLLSPASFSDAIQGSCHDPPHHSDGDMLFGAHSPRAEFDACVLNLAGRRSMVRSVW